MDDVLEHYLRANRQAAQLHAGNVLIQAARWVIHQLPSGPVELLARTDAGLLLLGAVAALRADPTRVRRLFPGRRGEQAAADTYLLEIGEPSVGLRTSLQRSLPEVRILAVPVPEGLADGSEASRVIA